MPAFITFGRVLFAVLFIFSGASKLLDLTATAQMTEKIVLPAALATYTSQLEGITGMAMPQMLAIATGALELICGLMIALNFGARFFAIMLILFVAAATFYFHDFWNQTGADARNNHDPRVEKPLDHRRAVHDRGIWPDVADGGSGLRRCLARRRRHGVTLTSSAASRICASPAFRPCAARISCGERWGTPGRHASPSGTCTCGACDSQNVS